MAVEVVTVEAQRTWVVAATASWSTFGSTWPKLLDSVWAAIRSADPPVVHGHNVMLYLDDVPNVEVGVEIGSDATPGAGGGDVVASSLPAGRVAQAVHVGSASGLRGTHDAVVAWCRDEGLELTGSRWEVYGDWGPDESRNETTVRWLLAPA